MLELFMCLIKTWQSIFDYNFGYISTDFYNSFVAKKCCTQLNKIYHITFIVYAPYLSARVDAEGKHF